MGSTPSKSESSSSSTSSSSAEPISREQKRDNLRIEVEKTIQDMMDNASNDKRNGKVYIVYENIADLHWISRGDDDSWREFKHWRLVIQFGFDWFTLEYLQDSIFTFQGLVVVRPFDPEATNAPRKYHVGDLKGLSTEVLFNWIQEEFHSKEEYNVITNNCQDFVHSFLGGFEVSGYLTRTGYLGAPANRKQLPMEGSQKIPRYTSDCINNWHLKNIGSMIVGASKQVKSASDSVSKP